MNKKYILYSLKKTYLPLILIFTISLAMIGVIAAFSAPSYAAYHVNPDGSRYQMYRPIAMMGLPAVSAIILATVLPLSTYHYRNKSTAADVYLQLPFTPRGLRAHNILIGLIILVFGLTVVFWAEQLFFLLKCTALGLPADTSNTVYERFLLNYGAVALGYLYILLASVAQYFICCFAVSAARSTKYAVLGIILFQLLLGFVLPSLVDFITRIIISNGHANSAYNSDLATGSVYLNMSLANPMMFFFSILYPWAMHATLSFTATTATFIVIGQVLFFGFAIFAGIYCFLEKERSGEHAGKTGFAPRWVMPVFHIGMLITGIPTVRSSIFGIGGEPLVNGLLLGAWFAGILFFFLRYFLLMALMRFSFKFKKEDWIWFISVSAAVLIFQIVGLYL